MFSSAALDAFERITSRAEDLGNLFRPGANPRNDDVRVAPATFPSTDPLSVSAPPGAWFVTRSADGARSYGRDGGLHVDGGALCSSDGAAVLGYPGGDARGAVPVPLTLPAVDVALGRCDDVHVEEDGTVGYTRAAIDPQTGRKSAERIAVGRIALARFPAGTQPVRIDAAHAAAPPGVVPHLGTPGDGTFPALTTHSRDGGSVDIDAGVARLNEAYRAFQALGAAVKSRASVEKTTLDLVK